MNEDFPSFYRVCHRFYEYRYLRSALHAYCENLNILHCNRAEGVVVGQSNSDMTIVNLITFKFNRGGG